MADICNIFLKDLLYLGCCKVSFGIPVLQKIEERALGKTYCPVSPFGLLIKPDEKLVSTRFADQPWKCGCSFDSLYGFRSFFDHIFFR